MTVVKINDIQEAYRGIYIGLSGDSKPTAGVNAGATFYESNTGDTYIYGGAAWTLYEAPSFGVNIGSVAAGENFIGRVGGTILTPVSTLFTRPGDATPYAAGDLVANSTTNTLVVPLQFTVARIAAGSAMIRRARLWKSTAVLTLASFRLHLYTVTPVCSNGDNAAWLTTQSAAYLGAIDVTCDKAFTDGATGNGTPNVGSEISIALASGLVIFGLTEARAAYTPGNAETFVWTLEDWPN